MFAAASQTCNDALDPARARKIFAAIRTAINEPRGVSSRRKRQIVAALFVGDSQVHTGVLPFDAVRSNPSAASAKLGENMSQLMPHGAIDFGRIFR